MDKGSDALGAGWVERRRMLGAAIRRARHPMTQAEVGAAVHRPQSCVSVWEKGGIEFGIDRIFELEELFELRHGALLEAAGYVDTTEEPWWLRAEAPLTQMIHNGSADAEGALGSFPRRLVVWLAEHGPMVETAARLREGGRDVEALQGLLAAGRLAELQLGWELWSAQCAQAGVSSVEILAATVDNAAVERCRYAVWGEDGPASPALRVVGQ